MMYNRTSGTVLASTRGRITILTINRPSKMNSLTQQVIDEGRAACQALAASDDVDVVILTGSGKAFCAGLDLDALGGGAIKVDGDLIEDVRSLPQTTIAAVNGPAVAGGLELALACDIRMGSSEARFADTHVRVGVPPGAGASVMLPRLVGIGRAREMSLSGRFVLAAEAERWGLLNRVVGEDVLGASMELAEQIAAHGPFARRIKAQMNETLDLNVTDGILRERQIVASFMSTFDPDDVPRGIKASSTGAKRSQQHETQ